MKPLPDRLRALVLRGWINWTDEDRQDAADVMLMAASKLEAMADAYENMRAWAQANGIDTISYGEPAVDKSAGVQTETHAEGGSPK